MIRIATAIAVLSALVGVSSAGAATLQQVGTFDQPIYVTSDPANPDRLFVVEREGKVKEVRGGSVSLFADLTPVVNCCGGERGLMSIALAPDFDSSGRLYAFYVGKEAGEIRVAELVASGPGGTAPLSTLRNLLTIPHPGEDNHYGGQLQIGPEGLLYIATGDGGGQDDQHQNAQSTSSLLGKVLRIDPRPSAFLPYTVPAGNPFALPAPYDTIWSLGLRNPYRFSFDRESGAMLIGDVGQGTREEVDLAPGPFAGLGWNYGWACREGTITGPRAAEPECATPPPGGYAEPIFEYDHGGPEGPCAIVGGYVVRDRNLGDLYGRYVYGDYCGEQLRSFALSSPDASDRGEGIGLDQLVSFGEDSCGRIYTVEETGRVALLAGNDGANGCPRANPPSASFVGIRATAGRRVKKGKRAQITAWVSPCEGRRGEPVKLMRGRKHLGTRRLDRACTVRFRPKISRKAKFRAEIAEDANYVAASSRKLQIKVLHKKKAKRRSKSR